VCEVIATAHDLGLALLGAEARPVERQAPGRSAHHPAVRDLRDTRPVRGAVLVVSDGVDRGCWGPVPHAVARDAAALARRLAGRVLADPHVLEALVRPLDRHAHAGAGAVARGALELACWDLLGQRHGVPVWRLLRDSPVSEATAVYATCFGIDPWSDAGARVSATLDAEGLVQKWEALSAGGRVAALLGPRAEQGLALDFRGRLSASDAARHVGELPFAPSWVEEPAPPGRLMTLRDERFPCRLAAGEHCYTTDDTHLLEQAGVGIWQPDAVFCGGFGAYRRMARRAAEANAELLPHGGGLLPALHAAALEPPAPVLEYHLLLEPRRQAHLAEPLCLGEDGTLGVPTLPGWHGAPAAGVL